MKFKKMSLFNFVVLVGLIGLLAGCGEQKATIEQKSAEEQVNTMQDKSSQIDNNNLLISQNQEVNGVKIPENNMYGRISVSGKSLTIPAARKKNWDYVMEKCDVKMCEVFGVLGSEYINYCKQEVKKCEKKKTSTKSVNKVGTGGKKQVIGNGQRGETISKDCSKIKQKQERISCYMQKVFDEKNKDKKCSQIIPKSEKQTLKQCIVGRTIDTMLQKKDIKVCKSLKKLPDEYIRCKDTYFMEQSQSKKDKTLCEKIQDTELKKVCKESIK